MRAFWIFLAAFLLSTPGHAQESSGWVLMQIQLDPSLVPERTHQCWWAESEEEGFVSYRNNPVGPLVGSIWFPSASPHRFEGCRYRVPGRLMKESGWIQEHHHSAWINFPRWIACLWLRFGRREELH